MGIFPVTQSHDDSTNVVDDTDVEKTKNIISEAMKRVNNQLKLNVELACETQVGNNIAETH
jgi:DNA polymerase I-like protein with 3'-5' exonuclease and polymerase domains